MERSSLSGFCIFNKQVSQRPLSANPNITLTKASVICGDMDVYNREVRDRIAMERWSRGSELGIVGDCGCLCD